MGAGAGLALRGTQFFLRLIQFCCSAIVLALFCYFLATLHNHSLPIHTWVRAVTGISGAAVLYTIVSVLLLCCLPGRSLPSFLMMVLDVAFASAFIYVAVANRGGASSCNGQVHTVYGTGDADTNVRDNGNGGFTVLPSLRQACRMETACLAVSIVAIFFFIVTPFVSLGLVRHRKKEQRIGPSPANNYTEGYGSGRKKLFGGFRLPFGRKRGAAAGDGQNPNVLPEHTTPEDMRMSYATEATRVEGGGGGYGNLGGANKYETGAYANATDNVPLENYPAGQKGGYRA